MSKRFRKFINLLMFNIPRNPTPEVTSDLPVKWLPVRTHHLEYLHIGGSKDLYMAYDLLHERMNFWATLPLQGQVYGKEASEDSPRDEL